MSIRKRKVLFIIPSLCGGGAERVFITLLRNLDRKKFILILAVLDLRGAIFLDQLPNDIDFINLNCKRVRYAFYKITRLIWKVQPDVVFSTLEHLNLAISIARKILPRSVLFIARNTIFLSQNIQEYRFPTIWFHLTKWFYKFFDLFICQSSDLQKDLIKKFTIPQHKTIVIHNPVEIDYIHKCINKNNALKRKKANLLYFVAAGRLVPQKGFDILIEAIDLVKFEQQVQLDILGNGTEEEKLKNLIFSKGLEKKINLVGFQKNPFVWFARADAFILSSRFEGFPNVVLEALACGTPVIATPAPGGVREILGGIPECKVAKEISAKSLARSISAWILGPRNQVKNSVIKAYTHERIISKYEKVLLK